MPLAFDIGQEFKLGEGKPGIGTVPQFQTIGKFISAILPNIYVFAGIILFFLLLFGSLTFIVNAGKGDQEGAKKGQQTITGALLGFLLIFASWWIMEIIKIITGIDILGGGGL